jgi:hypothetical protein
MQQVGKYLLIIAGFIALAGLILMLFGSRSNFLGRLPGDIRIEKENFRFYFPITTLILISLIINALIWLFRKFF